MISFEKVSEAEWNKNSKAPYENIVIPKRGSVGSAGYDFVSPLDVEIAPHSKATIYTGIKCRLDREDPNSLYVLKVYPRSSLGIKKNINMANTVGIIDSDYYGNENNEGHIIIALVNNSDWAVKIAEGDRFVQGIITKAYITSDDVADGVRTGGIGSTGTK